MLSYDQKGVKSCLTLGGFPQYLTLREKDVLTMLINDVLYRDIIVRYSIQDEMELKQLLLFLSANIGV